MTAGDGKPCKKCGTSEWDSNGYCVQCKKDNTRRWRENNREHVREYARKYREKHRLSIRKNHRAYCREWYKDHRDDETERVRRWRRRNPRKAAAISSRYRARKVRSEGNHTAAEFKRLCRQYNNRCLSCGRDDVELHADHVIPLSRGGSNDISNIQPLCKSCNSRKATKKTDYRTKPGIKRWIQMKLFKKSEWVSMEELEDA